MSNAGKIVFGFILFMFGPLLSAQNEKIQDVFLLGQNEAPSRWVNPVVPAFYDETGLHAEQFERVATLAQFYAIVSDVFPTGGDGTPARPSIGYVIGENLFDPQTEDPNYKLHPDIIKELRSVWGGSPLESALYTSEFRIAIDGIFDGSDCTMFINGNRQLEPVSMFQTEAVIIAGSSKLSPEKILQCFYNRTAMAFGLYVDAFEVESQREIDSGVVLYHGPRLAALRAAKLCEHLDKSEIFFCIDLIYRWYIEFAVDFSNEISLVKVSEADANQNYFDLQDLPHMLSLPEEREQELSAISATQSQVFSDFYNLAFSIRFEDDPTKLPYFIIDDGPFFLSQDPEYLQYVLYFAIPFFIDGQGYCMARDVEDIGECLIGYVNYAHDFYADYYGWSTN